jgi:hypothetical protein
VNKTLTIVSKRGASFIITQYGTTMPWLTIPHVLDPDAFHGIIRFCKFYRKDSETKNTRVAAESFENSSRAPKGRTSSVRLRLIFQICTATVNASVLRD